MAVHKANNWVRRAEGRERGEEVEEGGEKRNELKVDPKRALAPTRLSFIP